MINRLSKSLLVAIIIISIQDPALRIAAVCKVICLFKKGLFNITSLFDKYKSMFILFIENNKRMFFNIRVVFDLLGCFVISNKIIKGTKWDYITKSMYKSSSSLFGIDKIKNPTNGGAEYVSHFYEMSELNNNSFGKFYIPISDTLRKIERKGYSGKLHDGLHFDSSLETVSLKLEYKSSMVQYFGNSNLSQFESDYSKLGVDRIDLCHLNNSESYEKTRELVNLFDSQLLTFNPID